MFHETKWVPEEQRDTRWYLWNEHFTCRLPMHHAHSVDYHRNIGTPTTFDPALDRALAKQDVDRSLTIVQMLEHYKNGVSLKVKRYEDTSKIYNLIANHLNAWKLEIESSYTTEHAPLEDLLLMDEFASVVYDKAKHVLTQSIVDSIMARSMSSLLTFNKTNIIGEKPSQAPVATKEEEPDPYPKRQGFGQYFGSYNRVASAAIRK